MHEMICSMNSRLSNRVPYFFQIADPAQELKKAFDTHSPEPVTVPEVTSSSAVILVPGFATVSEGWCNNNNSYGLL